MAELDRDFERRAELMDELVREDEARELRARHTPALHVSSNLTAKPDCPSCHGSGWAVVRVDGITYATGACRCIGGYVWAVPKP